MNKRILIVEDEAIVARDIKQILEKNNFKDVGIANSVNKALEFLRQKKVDLILCDINLGKGGSGIDLVKKVKSTSGIHIVFISAYNNADNMTEALETTPDSYLTKPFTDEQLIVTVTRIFASDEKNIKQGDFRNLPTKRELEIVECIAQGCTSREIAAKLGISFETVQTHRKNLLHKYKLGSSAGLIAHAVKNGWID